MKANINVSEENEALLPQKVLYLTVETWSGTTQYISLCRDLKTLFLSKWP